MRLFWSAAASTIPIDFDRWSTASRSHPPRALASRVLPDRPSHVSTAGRSNDVSIMIDESTAQECAFHSPGELPALEWRISLFRFGLGGANHEALAGVDESDV